MGRRGGGLLLAAALAALVLVGVRAVPGVRPGPGAVPWVDDVVQPGGYLLATALAVGGAMVRAEARVAWSIVAAALALRAFALLHLVVVLDRRPEYPSASGVAWVLSEVLLVVGLAVLARDYLPRGTRIWRLDAVMGALAGAAVAVAVARDRFGAVVDPVGTPVPLHLVYPGLEVVVFAAYAALVAGTHAHLARAVVVLGGGVVALVVSDGLLVEQLASGRLQPGTWLGPLSLASAVLIAAAPWCGARPVSTETTEALDLTVPRTLAVGCLLVLAVGAVVPVPAAATLLAVAGMVVGLTRSSLTQTRNQRLSDDTLAEKDEELVRFRALVEASADYIALGTLQGQILYLNPAGRRLVGLPAEGPIPALTIAQSLTEEANRQREEVEKPQIMATGSWRGESALRSRDGGRPIPTFKNTFVLRDQDGAPWLLGTIQRDISELHEARRRLEALADERQELLRHLVTAQESERTRIASDVHDDSVQAMAAVDLRLGLLQRRVELGSDPEECLATLRELRDTVGHANERLRYLLFDLDSPAQRDGLVPALQEAAAYVLGPTLRWEVRGEDGGLTETSRVLAYRIVKEALVNVRKHAGASRVEIDVTSGEAGVEVVVADDGAGLPAHGVVARPGHRGVADMRDRAAVAGGTLEFRARESGGTEVRLWIPASAAGVG